MPFTSSPVAERKNRLDRLERMAERLDGRFRIPGLGLRFGWDSILGIIPGVGDAITVAPAILMIYEGARMGARKRVVARMGLNAAIDMVFGSLPVIGDLFDVLFKSHRRNIQLLKAELAREDQVA